MDFSKLLIKNPQLSSLLQQNNQFKQISDSIKSKFPSHIAEYFKIVCVQNSTLIIFAKNNMVANYLKMRLPVLKQMIKKWHLTDIKIKIHPIEQKQTINNSSLPLSKFSQQKILAIAEQTNDESLADLLLTIANKNNKT